MTLPPLVDIGQSAPVGVARWGEGLFGMITPKTEVPVVQQHLHLWKSEM